jgi:hypothetical protein
VNVKLDNLPGVAHVDRDFFSPTLNVWAKYPVGRDVPDYNERVYDFQKQVAELAFDEGYKSVNIHTLG